MNRLWLMCYLWKGSEKSKVSDLHRCVLCCVAHCQWKACISDSCGVLCMQLQ